MGQRMSRGLGAILVIAAGAAFGISDAAAETRIPVHAVNGEQAETLRGETALPIRRVTLYASGVGSFQHFGRVTGTETISMRFKTDQINDILKSMVLLDLDGGDIGAVTYASQEPLARRLASFGIDISRINNTVELLGQLRGSGVMIDTPEGRFEGSVLAVEDRMTLVTATQGGNHAHYKEPYVTIVTESGLRSFPVSGIRTLEITDERLRGELSRALMALAEHRADRSKAVEVTFSGSPNVARRVVASYVSEMPVWKSSYRLVLPDEDAKGRATLQAWAIVENTTDHDWTSVELALASGRPVSFVMNLYQTLFAPRPEVPVPLIMAVAPRIYEAVANRQMLDSETRSRERAGRGFGGVAARAAPSMAAEVADESQMQYELSGGQMADYAAKAQAAAGVVGEQFLFTVEAPVTLARQQSAMLPIANSAITGERVSVYAPGEGLHPMRGMRIENDAGIPLMPGPIAVYDGSVYAGDAQIPHTSRGMDRLLTYAVDLDVRVDQESKGRAHVQRFQIINGMLITIGLETLETTYTVSNVAGNDRVVYIEHPKRGGGWEIVSDPKPSEVTESINRFEIDVPSGESYELVVREQVTRSQSMQLMNIDDLHSGTALGWGATFGEVVRNGKMSDEIRQALETIANFKREMSERERAIRELDREVEEIDKDQRRIRENMTRLDRTADLYQRYVRTLTTQETRLGEIREQRATLSDELESIRKELVRYIESLKIR